MIFKSAKYRFLLILGPISLDALDVLKTSLIAFPFAGDGLEMHGVTPAGAKRPKLTSCSSSFSVTGDHSCIVRHARTDCAGTQILF